MHHWREELAWRIACGGAVASAVQSSHPPATVKRTGEQERQTLPGAMAALLSASAGRELTVRFAFSNLILASDGGAAERKPSSWCGDSGRPLRSTTRNSSDRRPSAMQQLSTASSRNVGDNAPSGEQAMRAGSRSPTRDGHQGVIRPAKPAARHHQPLDARAVGNKRRNPSCRYPPGIGEIDGAQTRQHDFGHQLHGFRGQVTQASNVRQVATGIIQEARAAAAAHAPRP